MARSLRILALLALIAFALAGCGGGDDDEPTSTAAEAGATGATGAVGTDQVPVDGPPDPELTVSQVAEALPLPEAVSSDPAFKETLDIFLAASHKYFSEALTDGEVDYHLPDEFIAYDGAAGAEGPDCAGEPIGVENAAYCNAASENGYIAWDETGLLEPLYQELGDGSIAFIIGHEFAHLAQDRIGTLKEFPLTIEKELNADCLTGAYLGGFGEAGVEYTKADIQSIIDGITVVGDAPGTPWQDSHAHGSAEERGDAFFQGFQDGFEHCLEAFPPGFSG